MKTETPTAEDPELKVGTVEYKKFRQWLHINGLHYSKNGLASLKPEYLMEYLNEYKSPPPVGVETK